MLKRVLALLQILILCLSLTACKDKAPENDAKTSSADTTVTDNNTPDNTSPDTQSPAATITTEDGALPLTVNTENTVEKALRFTLLEVQTGDKIAASVDDAVYFENNNAGKTYVDLVFDVTNLSTKSMPSHLLMTVSAVGDNDTVYNSALYATETASGTEMVQFESVAVGGKARLHTAVEIDETATELRMIVSVDGTHYTMTYTVGEHKHGAAQILIGDTVEQSGVAAVTVTSVNVADQVNPSDTKGHYSFYDIKDEKNTYLHVVMDVRNDSRVAIPVAQAAGMVAFYPDGTMYEGFAVVEADDHKSFYTDSVIESGATAQVHYLIEVTKPAERTEAELMISFGTAQYYILIALPALA